MLKQIFAIVESEFIRSFLIEDLQFPSSHIFESWNADLPPDLSEAISGEGVDVVLNTLTSDIIQGIWDAVADYGIFVYVGKSIIVEDTMLNIRALNRGVSLIRFDLGEIF